MNEILTERYHLFEPNSYIVFTAELSGDPDGSALLSAVRKAYAANEATTSRIVIRDDGRAFYEPMAQTGCTVSVARGEWQKIVQENEKKPFELQAGELMRCFIIPGTEKTRLLLIAHHLVGDGLSIVCFLKDVMCAMAGEDLAYTPMSLVTRDSIPHGEKLPFIVKLYAELCNRKWTKLGLHYGWRDYESIHQKYWGCHTSEFLYRTLDREHTEQITARAKQAGVSVNSYLVAALLMSNRHNYRIGIPVSIRDANNKAMANLVSGVQIFHRYKRKKSFVENARDIHRKVAHARCNSLWFYLLLRTVFTPAMIDGALMAAHGCCTVPFLKRFAFVMNYERNKSLDIGFSNLTVADIPSAEGKYTMDNLVFIPPMVSYANYIFGAVTQNGQLTLSCRRVMPDGKSAQGLFDSWIATLLHGGTD